MSRYDKPAYILSLACFFATLLIHLGTFLFAGLNSVGLFVPFHILAVVAGCFLALRYRRIPKWFTQSLAPKRMRLPLYILFAYFLLTMALMFRYFEGGSPTIVDGKPQLSNHGKFIRYLTDEEYSYAQRYELRFFSCGWMMAFAATSTYLAQLRENVRARMPQ